METNKSIERITKSIVQKLIRIESQDWPPVTMWGLYQSRRPSKSLVQSQDLHNK